jgi:uncharacterized protein (DUF58 family)
MIVSSPRPSLRPSLLLIVVTAVTLLPASVWTMRHGFAAPAIWSVVILLAAVAALDAIRAGRRFTGVQVTAPLIVRMTVDRAGWIPLNLSKPRPVALWVRIGLVLPPAMVSEQSDHRLNLETGQEGCTLTWPCRAVKRGRYALASCHIELASGLGLWAVRRRFALDGEIRVYPNLSAGHKNSVGLINRQEWGWRTLRKVGRGREFEQLRDYLPSDSYEDVDWKATARRRYPVTRVYQVEQSQEIYVVLDASLLSTRMAEHTRERRQRNRQITDPPAATIFERYVTAALIMGLAADQASDRYGLLIFGAKPECLIKAGRGKAHYNACRDALYNRLPQNVSPDFDELFAFIGTHLRKRAMLLFLTNLDDPLLSESFIHAMRVCARQHMLLVNMFRPAGAYPLFSSADIHQTTGVYEHLTGHMIWSSLSDTRRRMQQYGASFTLLDSRRPSAQLVSQYLEVKQRQIL